MKQMKGKETLEEKKYFKRNIKTTKCKRQKKIKE